MRISCLLPMYTRMRSIFPSTSPPLPKLYQDCGLFIALRFPCRLRLFPTNDYYPPSNQMYHPGNSTLVEHFPTRWSLVFLFEPAFSDDEFLLPIHLLSFDARPSFRLNRPFLPRPCGGGFPFRSSVVAPTLSGAPFPHSTPW